MSQSIDSVRPKEKRKKSINSNITERELQSLLTKERKKHVWKAFQEVERKNIKSKNNNLQGQ